MKTYTVTLEKPGLYDNSHYYQSVRVRAGSAQRAEQIAERRNGGMAVASSVAR